MATAGMAGADGSLGLILRSACEEAEPEAVAEDIAAMRSGRGGPGRPDRRT